MTAGDGNLVLLGYAAREWWLGREVFWGAEWKRQALAAGEVEKPLSIDRQVWPTVFDELDLEEPAYTGLFPGLWADLGRLETHLAARPELAARRWALAAFAVRPASCSAIPEASWREWASDVVPARLAADSDWLWRGLDVADRDGASALVVMRGALDERDPGLPARLARHLNRWHLLISSEEAARLVAAADAALPAHAPFCVYDVWTRNQPAG